MTIQGTLKVGDKVYRTIGNEPYEVVAIVDGKAHLKCGLDQRWVKVKSMTYGYTIVGSAADIEFRAACQRHGWKVWSQS